MLPQNNPDRIRIVFDDHRLVANAGLLLPATLAQHLGRREARLTVKLDPRRSHRGGLSTECHKTADAGTGRRNPETGDCIDDADGAACWWDKPVFSGAWSRRQRVLHS